MSIIITNVSSDDAPMAGDNNYLLRINDNIICNFTHDRKPNGLAQCLRDAANAVESKKFDIDKFIKIISEIK